MRRQPVEGSKSQNARAIQRRGVPPPSCVAGIIDEQPLAGRMRLPHRRRQRRFKAAIELAKPRITVTAGIGRDIFIPDDHQGDVLALQLPMNRRPIRLGVPAMAPFTPSIGVKRLLQHGIHHAVRQGPTQSRALEALQGLPHSRGRQAKTPRDIARWNRNRKLQTNNLAHMAHCNSLRWHRSLPWISKGGTLNRPAEALVPVPYPGRDYPVTVGGFIS